MNAEELEKWLAGMKAKANAAAKASAARIDEEMRAAKRAADMAYRARIKADPARHEEYKARQREANRRYHARLKADPAHYEEYRARQREANRRYHARLKAGPGETTMALEKARAEHAAFLEERAAYWRSYRAAQRMLAHIFKEEE